MSGSSINTEISDAVDIVQESWRMFQARWFIFLPIGLSLVVVNELSGYLAAVLHKNPIGLVFLINILVTSWLTMLTLKISLDVLEGKKSKAKVITADLLSKYVSFVAVTLISSVLIISGFVCLVLPGIYLMTILYFGDIFVMLGEKVSFEALKKSIQFVKGVFRRVLFCNILVACLLIIPIFIAQGLQTQWPVGAKFITVIVTLILVPFSSFTKAVLFKEMNEIKKEFIEEE